MENKDMRGSLLFVAKYLTICNTSFRSRYYRVNSLV